MQMMQALENISANSIQNVCSIAMWVKGEVMRIKWERLSLSLPQAQTCKNTL